MVKAYLRYELVQSFGVIAGVRCGSVVIPRNEDLKSKLGPRATLAAAPAIDTVVVWNLRTGIEYLKLVDHSAREVGEVSSIAAAPDGGRVAAGYADGSVRIWSLSTGDLERIFNGHVSAVTSLSWGVGQKEGNEDSLLVSGSADGELVVWDPIAEMGRFRIHAAHSNEVTAVRLLHGHVISTSKDGLMKVFEIATQSCVQIVVGHPGEIWCMEADQGFILTGSIDQEIRVWKVVLTEEPVALRLESIGSFVREGSSRCISIAFKRKGNLLVTHGAEKSVQLFHVRSEAEAKKHLRRRRGRRQEKTRGEDNMDLTADGENSTNEEQLQKPEAVDYFYHARSVKTSYKVRSVSFVEMDQSVKVLVHLHHNMLEVLEIGLGPNSGTPLKAVMVVDKPGHRGDVRAMTLTADDSTLLTLSSARTLKVWDPADGRCFRTIETIGYGLCLRLFMSEQYIVAGFKSGELQIFDFATAEEVLTKEDAHGGSIWGMEVLPSGDEFVTCSSDQTVKFWSLKRNADDTVELVQRRMLQLSEDVLCLTVTKNSQHLVVSLLDSTVRAFYLDTLKPFLTFYGHKLPVLNMDVSSDGTMLATGSADKSVKIWGMDFGDCRKSLRAHEAAVMSVAFQPDTHFFFTGSRDGKLKYWDGDRFTMITEMSGQRGEVWTCTVSRDGELVTSGSHDRSIRIWKRTDEMMFMEEEKNKRLDQMLESTFEEDERERRAMVSIVPEEVSTDTSLAVRRTLNAVNGAEQVMEALQLAEQEKVRTVEEPDEAPNVELSGLSAERYVLRAIKRLRRTDLESTLQLLSYKQSMLLLDYSSQWLNEEAIACVDVELIHRVVMYIVRTHQDQLVSGGDRLLISTMSERLHRRINQHRDNLGFNLAAMQYVRMEHAENELGHEFFAG